MKQKGQLKERRQMNMKMEKKKLEMTLNLMLQLQCLWHVQLKAGTVQC